MIVPVPALPPATPSTRQVTLPLPGPWAVYCCVRGEREHGVVRRHRERRGRRRDVGVRAKVTDGVRRTHAVAVACCSAATDVSLKLVVELVPIWAKLVQFAPRHRSTRYEVRASGRGTP